MMIETVFQVVLNKTYEGPQFCELGSRLSDMTNSCFVAAPYFKATGCKSVQTLKDVAMLCPDLLYVHRDTACALVHASIVGFLRRKHSDLLVSEPAHLSLLGICALWLNVHQAGPKRDVDEMDSFSPYATACLPQRLKTDAVFINRAVPLALQDTNFRRAITALLDSTTSLSRHWQADFDKIDAVLRRKLQDAEESQRQLQTLDIACAALVPSIVECDRLKFEVANLERYLSL